MAVIGEVFLVAINILVSGYKTDGCDSSQDLNFPEMN